MAASEWLLVISFTTVIGFVVSVESDGRTLLQLLGKAFLLFAVLALIAHLIDAWWTKIKAWRSTKTIPTDEVVEKDESDILRQQTEARRRIQTQHTSKAESYAERILKPREEARRQRLEDEHRRFAGPAWKGKGTALGGAQTEAGGDRSSKTAASARKLPDHIENPPRPPTPPPPKPKRRIVLPEQPPEGDGKAVTVALRTPGNLHKRRFYPTDTIQVLFDYMTTVGYHQQLYTLCTSYPRQDLCDQIQDTLAEAGILHHVTLNVEYRDR